MADEVTCVVTARAYFRQSLALIALVTLWLEQVERLPKKTGSSTHIEPSSGWGEC